MSMPQALRRLAMIAVEGDHQTPLTRVNGIETGVLVRDKGDKDVVEMVVLLRGGDDLVIPLAEGHTNLSPTPDWKAFFFRKIAGEGSKFTTIYVILRG